VSRHTHSNETCPPRLARPPVAASEGEKNAATFAAGMVIALSGSVGAASHARSGKTVIPEHFHFAMHVGTTRQDITPKYEVFKAGRNRVSPQPKRKKLRGRSCLRKFE
jgi:hypothetical protein